MRLPYVIDPRRPPYFPDDLQPDEYGLIAVGGVLSEPLVLEAYSKGIFPWFDQPPILWYSPDPRMVLRTGAFHLSKRTRRVLQQRRFQVKFDVDFPRVIHACATVPRPGQDGTWITAEMQDVYTSLHRLGFAHCVSVYQEGELVGGLYGLSLGAAFFGESMFSRQKDASKVAFHYLHEWARSKEFLFVDCQLPTPHLATLGAREIPRIEFLRLLADALRHPTLAMNWEIEGRQIIDSS